MDWKAFAKDMILFKELINRFIEIGCDDKKAYELATYVYAHNLPVVIKTTIVPNEESVDFDHRINKTK